MYGVHIGDAALCQITLTTCYSALRKLIFILMSSHREWKAESASPRHCSKGVQPVPKAVVVVAVMINTALFVMGFDPVILYSAVRHVYCYSIAT